MQIYKTLVYGSMFFGFVGLTLLFMEKIDKTIPKYFDYLGKCFITIGFCLLSFSVLSSRFNKKEDEKLSYYWIFFGVCVLITSIFFSIKKDDG
jgi:hypothetical protein